MADVRTSLYRHFDTAGVLLYVGISKAHLHRLVFHKKTASWYWDIARIEIEHFESIGDALSAEAVAIREEKPLYNKTTLNRMRPRSTENIGRKRSVTPEREAAALEMMNCGQRGNEVWRELQKMPGPPISRAAYYNWQKKQDGQRSSDRKRKYRFG